MLCAKNNLWKRKSKTGWWQDGDLARVQMEAGEKKNRRQSLGVKDHRVNPFGEGLEEQMENRVTKNINGIKKSQHMVNTKEHHSEGLEASLCRE